MDIVYTFPNTHTVISAEQVLLSANIAVKVRPIPTVIKAGCGLSLCVPPEKRALADEALSGRLIDVSAVYKYENGTYLLID